MSFIVTVKTIAHSYLFKHEYYILIVSNDMFAKGDACARVLNVIQ